MSSSRRKEKRQGSVQLSEAEAQEFMNVVRDDLMFLKALDYKTPSRTTVRVTSSILRRLLHEGIYLNAWRLSGLGDQPLIPAVDLRWKVAALLPRYIDYAYAGGAQTESANHQGVVLIRVPRAEAELEGPRVAAERVSQLVKPTVYRDFTLTEFCESPAVISGANEVSRVGVVKYVANKLGGVHWDNKRGEWSDPIGGRHRLLDEAHLIVGRLSAPLYEIISIAEAIACSYDTTRFVRRVEQVAPERERPSDVLSLREGRVGKYADFTVNSTDTSSKGGLL